MSYSNNIITSLFGRRLGLQPMSSAQSGSGRSGEVPDFLIGAEAVRMGVTTAETTSSNLKAYGVSMMTSVSSSGVYTLDPPIPGVTKYISNQTTGGTWYVKTANGETFQSSQASTWTVLKSTGLAAGMVTLVGLTTAIWGIQSGMSTATFQLSSST